MKTKDEELVDRLVKLFSLGSHGQGVDIVHARSTLRQRIRRGELDSIVMMRDLLIFRAGADYRQFRNDMSEMYGELRETSEKVCSDPSNREYSMRFTDCLKTMIEKYDQSKEIEESYPKLVRVVFPDKNTQHYDRQYMKKIDRLMKRTVEARIKMKESEHG